MNKMAISLSFLLLASPLLAGTRVDLAGQRVTVETDRYKVLLDGLTITHIDNKLTGETYASPTTNAPSPALSQLLADRGVQVESLRPAVPLKRFGLCDRTKVASRTSGDGATVTFTGLQYGTGKDAEFAANMTITLTLRVEPKTGDLLIAPSVKGNIEEVFGVRDRGVLRSSLHVLDLAEGLKMIIPAADGVAFTAADAPADWSKAAARFNWPMAWEAALWIAESERGCLGIWADEPKLKYGRHLSLARSPGRWHAGFEFETSDLIYQCDDITSATWRLNVFKGYWVHAARRYQQQMIAQWGMKPLAERTPAWADKVRVAFLGMVAEAAELLPRDAAIAFTSQGWLKGWNDGQIHRRKQGDYFPNWPLDNPVRYEAADGWPEQAAVVEKKGVHVFPYTNATIIDANHPWIAQKIHDRHFHSWRLWQRFYPEQCLDIVERYRVSGIYEDCSWLLGRHSNNSPDGENWYQGSVRTREYFRQLMPHVGLCGERNNEVTARGQHFALSVTQYPRNAHPIGCFLFEPFIRVWNLEPKPEGMDPDDVRGFISTWSGYKMDALQENGLVLKRGQVFAREQLRSHWPEAWDAGVMHYFKGQDGAEYRFVRDRGTRFVKLRPDGSMDTIYWRLHGVKEALAPGAGIEGWLAYDGDKIIGLNPNAPMYVTLEGVTRPLATIASVPEGFAVHRCVARDGYWLAALDRFEDLKAAPAPDAKAAKVERTSRTLRVRAARPVQFLGVESAKQVAPGEYEVLVALPGAFVAYWSGPASIAVGDLPAPPVATAHDRLNGLVYHRYEKPNLGWFAVGEVPQQEGAATWLVKLPAEPVRLVFGYGTNHGYGDGANYMVRVNGRELWKEYRPQQSADPEKAKAHEAPPVASAAVDLSSYAGQTVVLELADNGHHSGGSETIGWGQPRLERVQSQ
jgi:hypothetical protein